MGINAKLALSACAVLVLVLPGAPSFAMSKDQCEALFTKADTDNDGALARMEDPKWEQRITHMTNITKKDQGVISKDEFMTSCLRGEMDGM